MIGGDGLLTNLQFSSSGIVNGWGPIGFTINDQNEPMYQDIVVDYFIPKNFKIQSAYLTLYTTKVQTNYQGNDTIGSPKKLKLNHGSSDSTYEVFWGLGTSYFFKGDLMVSEILKAFEVEEYTPTIQDIGDVAEKTSVNLAEELSNKEGNNQLIVRTAVEKPVDFSSVINQKTLVENTGLGRAVLNVIGYMKFEEE